MEKLELIDENYSPLFRIMSVTNSDEQNRRKFENNICAFHIGNGIILSIAHNLRIKAPVFQSISDELFQNQIIQNLNTNDVQFFESCYTLDDTTHKRYLRNLSQNQFNQLKQKFMDIGIDTRYKYMYENSICHPYLIIQFRNSQFYNNEEITRNFDTNLFFHEPQLFRYTFLIKLELITAYYNNDIAVYKIVNTNNDIISLIPSIEVDFDLLTHGNLYCLHSAPINNLGRLLNDAKIVGILDHWNLFKDNIEGNYIFEGIRYLIEGYFRFGSSGAPYLIYDNDNKIFKVNSIQSEACPLQLAINGSREGNSQYVNAIATPMYLVKNELSEFLESETE